MILIFLMSTFRLYNLREKERKSGYFRFQRYVAVRKINIRISPITDANTWAIFLCIDRIVNVFFLSTLFTHCISVDSSAIIYWTSAFVILGMSGLFCRFNSILDGKSYYQTM